MRCARRWTRCVLLAALPLLAGGMALAGDDTTELLVLLDPARADIDGDGLVSPGEAMTFKELLGILTPEDPVLAQIVIAYGYAMDKGGVSPVDLTLLLEKAVTGVEAEEFALAALPPPCPCMAFTRGDANNSNTVDIADEIYILSFLFQSGSAPVPLDSGDANDDGVDHIEPLYWERRESQTAPPYYVDIPEWLQDPRQGSWSTTRDTHGFVVVPSVGPGAPFTVDVHLDVDVARTGGGAGGAETGDIKLHNGGPTNWALHSFLRIRCR